VFEARQFSFLGRLGWRASTLFKATDKLALAIEQAAPPQRAIQEIIMINIILKTGAEPGSNTDIYPNVASIGGTTLSSNAAGTNNPAQAADQAAAVTALTAGTFVSIVYTDVNNVQQRRVISTADVKTCI
jgi:hypothetical protein